jgi:hypothetical protein
LYSEKFDLDIQSSYSATPFLKAVNHKRTARKMFDLADNLWPKYEINSQAV